MKRDMELIREILLKIEERNDPPGLEDLVKDSTDVAEAYRVAYHLRLLQEQKFIIGSSFSLLSEPQLWKNLELTYRGHEFLDTVRDAKIWGHTKSIAKTVGGGGLKVFQRIAEAVLVESAKTMIKSGF
jgi:hypothetical protein